MGLKILQTAHYVPDKEVTNDDLAKIMDTSDKWISSRTGIKKRHLVQNEQTSDLSARVAEKLIQKSGLNSDQIDFIIVATMSPDYMTPATAAIVQGKIGAYNALAFDINAACSGFIYAMSVADKLLKGSYQYGIVIGAEVLSKLVDWQERSTAVLFGDGAGGVLVEQTETSSAVIAEDLTAFGSYGSILTAGYQPLDQTFGHDETDSHKHYFEMAGRKVYNFATRQVPVSIQKVADRANWSIAEVSYFLLHQANLRILTVIAHRLKQSKDKFLSNIAKYGNTSAASIPILLDETVSAGRLERGQKIILSGFGGGLTIGSIALVY